MDHNAILLYDYTVLDYMLKTKDIVLSLKLNTSGKTFVIFQREMKFLILTSYNFCISIWHLERKSS